MKMSFWLSCVCGALLLGTGCVGTLDGRHQAGVPLVNDTVEGVYERPYEAVWQASRDTLTYNGILVVENKIGSTMEATVDTRRVWVSVDKVNANLTRVMIQVRTKLGGTDKLLAAQLKEQIAVRLASGNTLPATPPAQAK